MELVGFIGMLEFGLLDMNFKFNAEKNMKLTYPIALQLYLREIIYSDEVPNLDSPYEPVITHKSKPVETYGDLKEMMEEIKEYPYEHRTTQFNHITEEELYQVIRINANIKKMLELKLIITGKYRVYEALTFVDRLTDLAYKMHIFIRRENPRYRNIRTVRRTLYELKQDLGEEVFYSGKISAYDFLPIEIIYIE